MERVGEPYFMKGSPRVLAELRYFLFLGFRKCIGHGYGHFPRTLRFAVLVQREFARVGPLTSCPCSSSWRERFPSISTSEWNAWFRSFKGDNGSVAGPFAERACIKTSFFSPPCR